MMLTVGDIVKIPSKYVYEFHLQPIMKVVGAGDCIIDCSIRRIIAVKNNKKFNIWFDESLVMIANENEQDLYNRFLQIPNTVINLPDLLYLGKVSVKWVTLDIYLSLETHLPVVYYNNYVVTKKIVLETIKMECNNRKKYFSQIIRELES